MAYRLIAQNAKQSVILWICDVCGKDMEFAVMTREQKRHMVINELYYACHKECKDVTA